jgi:hypothetical protein
MIKPTKRKQFKKKRTKLPREGAARRLILSKHGSIQAQRYDREVRMGRDIPLKIREACLARMHAHDKNLILYYPDVANFVITLEPNRSLPIRKFFDMFKGMIDDKELEDAYQALTNYRLEIVRSADDFVRIYDDENVHSCMSGPMNAERVRCWEHPENHFSLAAMYAPGGNRVIARTILNTQDMYYVRIFGTDGNSVMLANKLRDLGYHKLNGKPRPFKMYARCESRRYDPSMVRTPYFDWEEAFIDQHPETFDAARQRFEITVR